MTSEKYIGLDVHQATISVAVLGASGKLVMESILETKVNETNANSDLPRQCFSRLPVTDSDRFSVHDCRLGNPLSHCVSDLLP